MQFTAFLSVTFAILGVAAASPVAPNLAGAEIFKRGCDCAGHQACCQACFNKGEYPSSDCCALTCTQKFGDCMGECN